MRDFQQRHGIAGQGVVEHYTWAALRRAVAEASARRRRNRWGRGYP